MQQPDETESGTGNRASAEQLAAIQSALEQRFEDLLRDARVFAHSLCLPGDRESAAQDALQAAVETAFRLAETYDLARPAYPWLRKLVFNAVRSHRLTALRRQKRTPTLSDVTTRLAREQRAAGSDPVGMSEDELLGRLGAFQTDPDPAAEEAFDQLIAPLGDADQHLLRLVYQEEFSGADLAARLGCTTGAAYTRLSRAHKRLLQCIRASGHEES